jgi:hypothetical protein
MILHKQELRDLRTRLDTRTAAFDEMGLEVTRSQAAAAAAKKQLAEVSSDSDSILTIAVAVDARIAYKLSIAALLRTA